MGVKPAAIAYVGILVAPGDLRRSRTVSANILTVVAALFVSVLIAEGISRLLPRGYYH